MGKIIELPFSADLVKYLGDRLLISKGKDLSNITVVFPGKRPEYYLRKFLSEKLSSPYFPPRIFSIDSFITELHREFFGDFRMINPADGAWIIYQITKEEGPFKRDEFQSFDSFFFWGIKIYEAFDELDKNLIESSELKGLLEQPQFINEEFGINEYPEGIRNLLNSITEAREKFQGRVEELEAKTKGMIYREVAEEIPKRGLPWEAEKIYFSGLSALTRSEGEILGWLLKNQDGEFIYQAEGKEWTLFDYIKEWKGSEIIVEEFPVVEPKITLHKGFDTHSQVTSAGLILKGKNPFLEETAIVLPDSRTLIPLLSNVLSFLPCEYNISMGYPLQRTPVYALLDLVMKLQENRKNGLYYTKDYLNLIMHPYAKNLYLGKDPMPTRILIHHIEELLIKLNKPFISLEEVENLKDNRGREIYELALVLIEKEGIGKDELRGQLKWMHNLLIRGLENLTSLKEVSLAFSNILEELLKNSPARLYPFSGVFFSRFINFFENLGKSLFAKENIEDKDRIFSLIRYSLLQERVPFEGIPLKGLQVIGLLETRALRFRNVIVLDVNEDILPATEPVDPILPTPVRKHLGLPTYRERENIFRYYLMRLIKGAENVHLIYSESEERSKSRFIEEIVWDMEKKRGEGPEEKTISFGVFLTPQKELEVEKSQKTMKKLLNMEFSPTKIDTYLKCPLKFYYQYILGLEEREEIETDVESRRVGSFVHKVLQRFYEPFISKDLSPLSLAEERMNNVIEEVFKDYFKYQGGEFLLLKEVVKVRLGKFMEGEKAKKGLKIIALEKDYNTPIEVNGREITLKGRVDRIHLWDGEYTVVDYKTGSSASVPAKNIEEPLHSREEMKKHIRSFQLPIYLYLFKNQYGFDDYSNINAVLYLIGNVFGSYEKMLFGKNFKGDRGELIEEIFLPSLRNLVSEILNQEIPFTSDHSDERLCENCPFRTM